MYNEMKIYFSGVPTNSESLRGCANSAQVGKVSIDLDHYKNFKKRLEAAEKLNTFCETMKIKE